MNLAQEIQKEQRIAIRNLTDAAATCSPFTSTCPGSTVDGLVCNFSSNGCYIETSQKFQCGTMLIVRLTQYPATTSLQAIDGCPRSISVAEVKWQQKLRDDAAACYGPVGLKISSAKQ
jgi:hypothetical protein